jgi:hypothetical protein
MTNAVARHDPPGQLDYEDIVSAADLTNGAQRRESSRETQIVEPDSATRGSADQKHAGRQLRRAARDERRGQAFGERKPPQVVGCEVLLDTFPRELAPADYDPGVMNEDMNPWKAGAEHRPEVIDVED